MTSHSSILKELANDPVDHDRAKENDPAKELANHPVNDSAVEGSDAEDVVVGPGKLPRSATSPSFWPKEYERSSRDEGPPSKAEGSGSEMRDLLPSYARSLLAYHRTHKKTLHQMMDELPIEPDAHILDLATGDGTYAMLLARRGARVVAVDKDERYLAFAQRRARRQGLPVQFRKGDAFELPFQDNELDGAFCAQSLYDLRDVPGVIRELHRVVRKGGWVGIVENDSLHHLVLPWPPQLELRVGAAQLEALSQEPGDESRFYVGRRLAEIFPRESFRDAIQKSFSTQINAPLTKEERVFLEQNLAQLADLVRPHLKPDEWKRVQALCAPESAECMLHRPTFSATVLDFLAWARVKTRS